MTDREKAIVMAHTGITMLTGDKFQIFHKYIEDIMGRPIMTHEIGLLADSIKEKSKADFLALCAEQEPTTKNDLAVSSVPKKNSKKLEKDCESDCISRKRAIERLKLNLPISQGADNSRDRHRYMQSLADIQAIRELPSSTLQEPKFIAKSDGTIEQINNCDDCLYKKEWEKIGKLISVILEKPLVTLQKSEWEHDHEVLKAYSDGVNEVLDKIRVEIEQLHLIGYATVDGRREVASRAVLKILDKYTAESEE